MVSAWKQGEKGIAAYNEENKVAPMKNALRELNAGTWFAGLRRSQSRSRGEDTVSRLVRRSLESAPDRGLD